MESNKSPLPGEPLDEGIESTENKTENPKNELPSSGQLWNRLLRLGLG